MKGEEMTNLFTLSPVRNFLEGRLLGHLDPTLPPIGAVDLWRKGNKAPSARVRAEYDGRSWTLVYESGSGRTMAKFVGYEGSWPRVDHEHARLQDTLESVFRPGYLEVPPLMVLYGGTYTPEDDFEETPEQHDECLLRNLETALRRAAAGYYEGSGYRNPEALKEGPGIAGLTESVARYDGCSRVLADRLGPIAVFLNQEKIQEFGRGNTPVPLAIVAVRNIAI